MHPRSDRDRAIERALRGAARRLESVKDGGWRLTIANGTLTPLRARVFDGDWLVVTAPFTPPLESGWPLLWLNAGLGGSARLARDTDGALDVRAEIFVADDAEADHRADGRDACLMARVGSVCEDIVSVTHKGLHSPPGEMAVAMSGSCDTDRLVQLCGEAGWSATARASGEVHVALDTRAGAFEATLALNEEARLRAVVPLTPSPVAPGARQDAVACLLLEAAAHLRTVKGCVIRHAEADLAGIAVAGERLPASPASVDRALAALMVACTTVGREVRALQDEELARHYLARRRLCDTSHRVPLLDTHPLEDIPCLQLPS